MARSTKAWRGATDDAMPPPRVRQRVLERYDRICQLSHRPIAPGDQFDLDHKVALILGGRNDEDNLWPVLRDPHKRKTAMEMQVKAKIARTAQKHSGARQRPKQQIQSRGFEKAAKERKKAQKVVPVRAIYK